MGHLNFKFLKYTQTPKLTKSMRIAIEDLKLDQLTVIYPGDKTIHLTADISAIGLEQIDK